MSGDNSTRSRLNRRRLLQLTGAGAAAGLAGCAGDEDDEPQITTTAGGGGGTTTGGGDGTTTSGGDDTASDDTTASGELVEPVHDVQLDVIPTRANFNVYATKSFPSPIKYILWLNDHMTVIDGTTFWMLQEEDGISYDASSKTLTRKYKEGYTWWNGEPVTAAQRRMIFEYNRLTAPEASNVEEHTLVDDYTMETVFKKPQNPNLVTGTRPNFNEIPWVIQPYYEDVQDASSQDERDKVVKELGEDMIGIEKFVSEGWGNGLYEISEWDSQQIMMEKREDHPHSDRTNLPKIRAKLCKGNACDQLIINDDTDSGHGVFPTKLEARSPDYIQNLAEYGGVGMLQVIPNYNNKHLRKRKFRRALVHIINNEHIVTNNESGQVVKNQWGMIPTYAEQYLGEETMSKFIDYPHTANPEGATQLLEELGYSKEGKWWQGPDGEQVELNFPAVDWGDQYTLTAKTVAEQLKGFGINAKFVTMNTDALVNRVYQSGEYDLVVLTHYGGYNFHPRDYFSYGTFFGNAYGFQNMNQKMKQWTEEGKERSPFNGKPLKPTIPTEIGAKEVSGEGKTFTYYDLFQELETTGDPEREKEIIETFAWYWNFDVPGIQCYQFTSGAWGDTQNFGWPEKNASILKAYRAPSFALSMGEVQGVTK